MCWNHICEAKTVEIWKWKRNWEDLKIHFSIPRIEIYSQLRPSFNLVFTTDPRFEAGTSVFHVNLWLKDAPKRLQNHVNGMSAFTYSLWLPLQCPSRTLASYICRKRPFHLESGLQLTHLSTSEILSRKCQSKFLRSRGKHYLPWWSEENNTLVGEGEKGEESAIEVFLQWIPRHTRIAHIIMMYIDNSEGTPLFLHTWHTTEVKAHTTIWNNLTQIIIKVAAVPTFGLPLGSYPWRPPTPARDH